MVSASAYQEMTRQADSGRRVKEFAKIAESMTRDTELFEEMPFTREQVMDYVNILFRVAETRSGAANGIDAVLNEAVHKLNDERPPNVPEYLGVKSADIKLMMVTCFMMGAWLERKLHEPQS